MQAHADNEPAAAFGSTGMELGLCIFDRLPVGAGGGAAARTRLAEPA